MQCQSSSDSPERARLVKQIAGLHIGGSDAPRGRRREALEDACLKWAGNKENVEVFWCGEPPKDGVCTPTPSPTETYSYNFETMQPTLSPTPQATPP